MDEMRAHFIHAGVTSMRSISINISCLRHFFARTISPSALVCLLLTTIVLICSSVAPAQRRVDDPDDQEDLNRELWEFAQHTPYESILSYVAEAQRRSKANESAEAELP